MQEPTTWAPPPAGILVDAALSTNLAAMAFCSPDGRGALFIYSTPAMEPVAEMRLDGNPQEVVMSPPAKGSGDVHVSLSYEGGGVEAWVLQPAAIEVS